MIIKDGEVVVVVGKKGHHGPHVAWTITVGDTKEIRALGLKGRGGGRKGEVVVEARSLHRQN